MELLAKVKLAVRVKNDAYNEELSDLIEACKLDMKRVGIVLPDPLDSLAIQAIKFYCKAIFGYDEKADRYRVAYEELRDSMSLSVLYQSGGI